MKRLVPFLLPLLPALFVIIFVTVNRSLTIYPGKRVFESYYYSDALLGGNSEVHYFTNLPGNIILGFTLKDKAQFPFAGVGFNMSNPAGFDTTPFDAIRIELKNQSMAKIKVQLKYIIPGYSLPEKPLSYLIKSREIEVTNVFQSTTHRLKDFKPENWWFKNNTIQEKEVAKSPIRNLTSVELSTSDFQSLLVKDEISLKKVTLIQDNRILIFSSVFLLFLYYCMLFFFRYRRQFGKASLPGQRHIELADGKVPDIRIITEYMANHYQEPELSLPKIQMETGVPQTRISKSILNEYGLSFKQYLNKLRMEEAKHLLVNTDRAITDIAFLTGYSNTTHFNRIFKEQENMTPKEFRKKYGRL